ncbi:MAG: hypothetical protein Q9168_001763 [Polycauliona sp. 1 TL-2023]
MSGRRLLDAAAIFKATGSVVSKHAALRTHQFDAYQKTSSLVKAVRGQTDRVTFAARAASAPSGHGPQSSGSYSTQPSSQNPTAPIPKVPSHDSVQNPGRTPVTKEGLEQDHFYERSQQNSTEQSVPKHDIGVKQEAAKRYPFPDGSVPPAESDLTSNIELASAGRKSNPNPSNDSASLSPDEARKLQREAEKQIPSQAAEPPAPKSGVGQEQDVFHTPPRDAGRVLSALPRVKLPKNTVDEQSSVNGVPDQGLNQDVFYSSVPNDQEQALPEQQAVPQQREPSEDMYSELFHSPKVAKILKGKPKPADSSKGLGLEGAITTPGEGQMSQSRGDPESFNIRPTAEADKEETGSPGPPAASRSSHEADIQTLAADIASDTSHAPANADGMVLDAGDAAPKAPFEMHESRVPSSRFGRLWQYGGLATSMAFGAVGESFRRATGSTQENAGSLMLSAGNMERLVAKLSKMRGAALKLGQMMSFQDSKMLPAPIHQVLQRVQDSADYMPASQRNQVLADDLGSNWRDLFSSFDEKPIAAASIGQVHSATMKASGIRVAVKVQYPGVANSIDSDLNNLSILLTASRLLPKGLYLDKTIANARTELGWECDYIREAECGRRFKKLLQDEQSTFTVPSVIDEASGAHVLTAEMMDGVGVTKARDLTQEQKDWIGTQILRLCLREITEFKFMQTDPNWTNFLFNSNTSKLELLDFGASRDYPDKFIIPYMQILQAASRNDREGICDGSIQLGYLTGHESTAMINAHVSSVLTLAEPFSESSPETYDFRDQTITDRVRKLIPVMVRERLAPPPEETYSLHRKLSGAFLLCARLGSRVRCRELFAKAMAKNMSNILITSASGNIGTPLIPLLLASPAINHIILPTTNASKLSSLVPPSSDRITILSGSIQNPAWVEQTLTKHAIDTVFLNLTGVDELFTTCNFLSALLRSPCVRHLIYLSACGDLSPATVFQERFGGMVPAHVVVKTVVEQMLRGGSTVWNGGERTYTILGPSLFFSNDLRGKASMMGPKGAYGEPIGTRGVSRVDVKDIALAVVKVAEEPERWSGKKIMIGSRELYTEHDFSRFWTEGLGKPIRMAPNNAQGLDQLEEHISAAMDPMWARDLRLMYQLFDQMVFGMNDEEYKMQKELLGKEPSSYEHFVRETAAEWKKELS